ncbi:Gfo/Idh/MocA family protein [Halogranum amylolyticum]|nr:Gfo/Idh/MocA family oxidoreductase [Halogranum amylolyticum]
MDVGIVGTGNQIVRRVQQWQRIDHVSVVGITTTDGSVPDVEAPLYEDSRALMDSDIDAIDCVTGPTETCSVACPAIKNGIAVLLPWPVTNTVAEAEAIISAADQTTTPVVGGLTPRFDPARRRAKERIANGTIGQVGNVRLRRRLFTGDIDPLVDVAALELDFLQWVCEDLDRVFVRRGDGIDAILVTGRSTNDTVFHLDTRHDQQDDLISFEFAGDAGLIEFDSRETAGVVTQTGTLPPSDADPMHRMLTHFHECVVGEATPIASASDATAALRIGKALVQSEQRGAPVAVNKQRPNS